MDNWNKVWSKGRSGENWEGAKRKQNIGGRNIQAKLDIEKYVLSPKQKVSIAVSTEWMVFRVIT